MSNSSPDADYLMSDEIGLVIAKGMQVLYKTNPKNPVDFLAKWLLNQSQTNQRESAAAKQQQEIVDQAMNEFYHPTHEGLIGNEDVGQMSAWYVMSALGFYQVTPGEASYTIGRPLFDKAVIPVADGKFTITSENNSQESIYVKSVTINGKQLSDNFSFAHSDLKDGGELHFVMTSDKSEAMKAQ